MNTVGEDFFEEIDASVGLEQVTHGESSVATSYTSNNMTEWFHNMTWYYVDWTAAPPTCIAAQEESLFCGREDGTVAVWDLDAARGGGRWQSERGAQSGSMSTWRYQLGVATLQDI